MTQNGTNGRLSRAAAIRAARDANTETFTLAHTGTTVRVRRLTLQDLIALDAIPTSAQATVDAMIEGSLNDDGSTKAELTTRDLFKQLGGATAGIRLQAELADAAVVIGFVDPRVVRTEDEISDPETTVWIQDIDRRDRLAFWEWVNAGEAAEAGATAAIFPQPAAAPDAGSLSDALRHDALSLVAPIGGGL